VTGALLTRGLEQLPGVVEVRGLGLLLGAELDRPASEVVDACLERGLLVGSAGERVLRLTPPLTVGPEEVDEALAVLEEVLR
jgi:acetylornithine/N-succinyldiaminopimelate aminotransferase